MYLRIAAETGKDLPSLRAGKFEGPAVKSGEVGEIWAYVYTGNQPTSFSFKKRAQFSEETVGNRIKYKQDRDNSKEEKRRFW